MTTPAALTDAEAASMFKEATGSCYVLNAELRGFKVGYALGVSRTPAVPREQRTTICWKCSTEYAMDRPRCPCGAPNLNAMTDEDRTAWLRAMYDAAPKADDQGDAGVAPRMNSEPGNPERDKRAMYRPAHQGESCDSASANPNPIPLTAPAQATELEQRLRDAWRDEWPSPSKSLVRDAANAIASLRAENARLKNGPAQPCCGDWDNCPYPCAPLATHWHELADKYKWQVRDTCARAERAEARADRLAAALGALGVIGSGYCFCSRERDPDKAQHEPECRDARAALAQEDERD